MKKCRNYHKLFNLFNDKVYHKQKHIEHSGFHITTPHSHSLQEVSYNAFKKPVDVYEKDHGRLSFEYSPMLTRSHVWYGGEEETKTERRYRKYYASIAPIAIEEDTQAKTTKIITYIGGDAYTAPVVSISSAAATGNSSTTAYYYLHRDYLGSITAISDSGGSAIEKRHFGAWGSTDAFWAADGTTSFDHNSLLNRGFTGHEHFFKVGLVHMNGRMYNPILGRFLSPDNFVQDPYYTQSFNRYSYIWRTERKENSLWLFLANGPAGAPGSL